MLTIAGEIKVSYVDILDQLHKKYDMSKVLHDLSGGADSALALYLHIDYCKSRNIDTQFFTYTDTQEGINADKLYDLILFFNKDITPFIKTIEYDQKTFMSTRQELHQAWKEKNKITAPHINGVTINPPVDEQRRYNFPLYKGTWRDTPKYKTPGRILYNMNKRDVYDLYKKHNILELWDLTYTCTDTLVYGDMCMKCWACYERIWAEYDNHPLFGMVKR